MAQTKRKRRTKHRGNAAGVVEARGRTGRRPSDSERKPASAREQRARKARERHDSPPTWRSAINRALIAAAIMFPVAVVVLRIPIANALALLPIIAVFYVPMGYYTDLFIHRRRMRSKSAKREPRP